jgi:hypothetical protein
MLFQHEKPHGSFLNRGAFLRLTQVNEGDAHPPA